MAARQTPIAEALGVSPDSIEGEIKIRRPEDPLKRQQAHDKDMLILRLTGWVYAGAVVLTFALCWLFLYYGKPEQAEKVVATILGLLGGFGIGRVVPGKD